MTVAEKPAGTAASETISQSEIERLLSQFGAGDSPVAESEQSDAGPGGRDRLGKHLFPQLSFFSGTALRKLRLRHEELIRYVGAQLASYLRLETVLQMSKLETMPFQKFIDGLSDPTHLTLFNLAPLRGVCLLDIPPRLGLCLVDRQLGGPALKVDTSRNLSEIEVRLISRVSELILSQWCSYWSSLIDLRQTILGYEGNGRFVESSSPNTMMLVLGVTAWVGGEIMDEMQLAFPHFTLEPLIKKLASLSQDEIARETAESAAAPKWNPVFDEVDIPITVELPPTQFSTRKLAALSVGDFIQIEPSSTGKVIVRLGGLPKFVGELGAAENRRAVKITGVKKSKKPVHAA